MNKDSSKGKLEMVFVDGGMTRNDFLLQLLANILGIPVGMSLYQGYQGVCVYIRDTGIPVGMS